MNNLLVHDAYIEIICDVTKNDIVKIGPSMTFTHKYVVSENGIPKTLNKKGKILDIIKDENKIIVDMSVEYRSNIEEFDISTFVSTYYGDLFGDHRVIPEVLYGRVNVIDTGRWALYDTKEDCIYRDGDIIHLGIIADPNVGRLFDIKVSDEDFLFFKVDCSQEGKSIVHSYENRGRATKNKYGLKELDNKAICFTMEGGLEV